MAHNRDLEPATHLRAELCVRARTVAGLVYDEAGHREAFDGWLGLLGAIDAAQRRLDPADARHIPHDLKPEDP